MPTITLRSTSPATDTTKPISPVLARADVPTDLKRAKPLKNWAVSLFNCRHLWGRDGAVHDGFMGLVSCLDQLDLRVLYDGPVGSYGCEAGFLFHFSIHSSPIPTIADLQSLCWRLVSGVICVCSNYAPHVGISVDARVEFWRTLAGSVHRVSHTHIQLPMLLVGDSNVWLPPFHLGRSRQADSALVPII